MFNNIFSHRGIGFRIVAGFFLVIIIGTVSSVYGLSAINKVSEKLRSIAKEDIPMTAMLTEINTRQLEQAILLERVLRLGSLSSDDSNIKSRLDKIEKEFIHHGKVVGKDLMAFRKQSEKILQSTKDEITRQKYRDLEEITKSIVAEYESYKNNAEQLFRSIYEGQTEEEMRQVDELILLAEKEKLGKAIASLLANLEEFTKKSSLAAENQQESAIATMSMLTLIGFITGLLLSVLITRGIVVPLKKTLAAMNDIAEGEGDLTRRLDISGNDEVSQVALAFNKFANKIETVVTKVRSGVTSISSASQEISIGNASLSQRTEEQASSLEETASSMEEMTSTVQQNASSANKAQSLAESNRQTAMLGVEVVGRTVDAMNEINSSSSKISEIISTIDGIAFQTNLLALNAAVEAARAGEQGRGFAVVASEVRTLAQRSADAAKEIKTLIEDSVGKVKVGTTLVDESGKTLEEITEGIEKVAIIVREIAASSSEQAAGIEQVNTAVTQMDDMTQKNAALVEEAAAASRSMQEQTSGLVEVVSYFKVTELAGSSENFGIPEKVAEVTTLDVASQVPAPGRKRTGTNNNDWEDF